MSRASDSPIGDQFAEHLPSGEKQLEAPDSGKRNFVEPEISVPVDVLEATTFFQQATSGGTNP